MAPHVERMVAEGEELAARVEKLSTFTKGSVYRDLDDVDQALLNAQLGAMTSYLSILSIRMDRAQA